MTSNVRVTGLRELEAELEKLATPATRKASARRGLMKAAQPMADVARQLAPNDPATSGNDLSSSIAVSTRLSPRQASIHRKMFRDGRSSVEVFVGPGPDPAAHNQEFGNINHGPQPFMRPAFDQEAEPTLARLKTEIWTDIEKSVARATRRAARLAAKAKG